MPDANLFWTIFAATLGAIMLGGTFFWGLVTYSKHERDGTAGKKPSHAPLLATIVPIIVFGLAFHVAMNG